MSDKEEARTEALMHRLGHFAQGLALVLSSLPIPISVPTGDVSLITDIRPAFIRAYDLVEDQPMPDLMKATAVTTLLYWIAASEMTMAYALSGADYRADAATLNMLAGEDHLSDLIDWVTNPGTAG